MTSDTLIWIREAPKDSRRSCVPYYVRRSHKKSRNGCACCKLRRVKCDEKRPSCSQCSRRGISCSYLLKAFSNDHSQQNGTYHDFDERAALGNCNTTSDLGTDAYLGFHVFATAISRAVDRHNSKGISNNDPLYILQHFERTGYATCSSFLGQRILHDKIPRMLIMYPFLMQAVLAFSSSHLEYLTKDMPHREDLIMASSYHTQRALRLYARQIHLHQKDNQHVNMNTASGQEEMDALFAACILLTSLFYSTDPHRSWALSISGLASTEEDFEPRIDWLTNTSGLGILLSLNQFQGKLEESIWLPFIHEGSRLNSYSPGNDPWTGKNSSTSTTGPSDVNSLAPRHHSTENSPINAANSFCARQSIPAEAWLEKLPHIPPYLRNLAVSSSASNIYIPALTLLSGILALDPTNLNYFGSIISFPSRLSAEFIALLRQESETRLTPSDSDLLGRSMMRDPSTDSSASSSKGFAPSSMFGGSPAQKPDPDPVTLLILGYWFDMVGQVPHWWCSIRGSRERVAILSWLKEEIKEIQPRSCYYHCEGGWKMLTAAVEEFEWNVKGRKEGRLVNITFVNE